MRTLRLARVAAEAEKLRLSRIARRIAIRLALAAVTVLFILATLGLLHIAAFLALAGPLSMVNAALTVAGIDLVLAIVVGLIAAKRIGDPVAIEARQVRDHAIAEIRHTFTIGMMLRPIVLALQERGLLFSLLRRLLHRN